MATPKIVTLCKHPCLAAFRAPGRAWIWAVWLLLAALASSAPVPATEPPAVRAERIFQEARQRLSKNPQDTEAGWLFARACFDWAEFSGSDSQRADVAQRGIDACRHALKLKPDLAASHYYLALNLGQLARTKRLSALKLVDEMEDSFKQALKLDAVFHHAGPHRSLGLLYLEAPAWPASVGNRSKARQHLRRAVELRPNYPDNRLCLMEAYLKWNEKKSVQAQLEDIRKVLTAARETLTGDEWESSWRDWDLRWEQIQTAAGPPAAASPSHEK